MKNTLNHVVGTTKLVLSTVMTKPRALVAAASLLPMTAFAATAPAPDTPGYELYKLFTDLTVGPLGFVGAMSLFLWAGSMLKDSYWKAGAAALGGGLILKADAITESFGAMIIGV